MRMDADSWWSLFLAIAGFGIASMLLTAVAQRTTLNAIEAACTVTP